MLLYTIRKRLIIYIILNYIIIIQHIKIVFQSNKYILPEGYGVHRPNKLNIDTLRSLALNHFPDMVNVAPSLSYSEKVLSKKHTKIVALA